MRALRHRLLLWESAIPWVILFALSLTAATASFLTLGQLVLKLLLLPLLPPCHCHCSCSCPRHPPANRQRQTQTQKGQSQGSHPVFQPQLLQVVQHMANSVLVVLPLLVLVPRALGLHGLFHALLLLQRLVLPLLVLLLLLLEVALVEV